MRKSVIVLAGILTTLALPALALASEITFVNHTVSTADFYVDGGYACRALSGLECSSNVNAGSHNLDAKLVDGRSTSNVMTLAEGESNTWTIFEQQ